MCTGGQRLHFSKAYIFLYSITVLSGFVRYDPWVSPVSYRKEISFS